MRAIRFSVQARDVRIGDIIELLDPDQPNDGTTRAHVTSISFSESDARIWLDRETDDYGQPLTEYGEPDHYGHDLELRPTDQVIVLRSV